MKAGIHVECRKELGRGEALPGIDDFKSELENALDVELLNVKLKTGSIHRNTLSLSFDADLGAAARNASLSEKDIKTLDKLEINDSIGQFCLKTEQVKMNILQYLTDKGYEPRIGYSTKKTYSLMEL